ncbi:hypothetical protein [Streptomyces sp. NBC_01563]|uniref:hypothetical protein n=1 Tax=Streptomyces sp. NBC_01563 TaxID=2975880 RepID=UPI0038637047
MTSAPITVHQHSSTGGRRVTAHVHSHDEFLGTAFSDHDLVVFLEAAGIPDADTVLDNPRFIEWRGGHAHEICPMPLPRGQAPSDVPRRSR